MYRIKTENAIIITIDDYNDTIRFTIKVTILMINDIFKGFVESETFSEVEYYMT